MDGPPGAGCKRLNQGFWLAILAGYDMRQLAKVSDASEFQRSMETDGRRVR